MVPSSLGLDFVSVSSFPSKPQLLPHWTSGPHLWRGFLAIPHAQPSLTTLLLELNSFTLFFEANKWQRCLQKICFVTKTSNSERNILKIWGKLT
jgi:hypothetical protein